MLTPAKKKYLFTIYEIGLQKAKIRSVDIAKSIRISKASVCNMLPDLVENGLVEKDSDGIVALTYEGEKFGKMLYDGYKSLYGFFCNTLKSSEGCAREDALTIICNLTDENANNMSKCSLVDAAR